jgi:pyruvate dehydrogenase E2 component (dihydrolipoamide acetyltransferase)
MSWKIGMPNLGHTMEEGRVSEWLKAVGDPVSKGEVIGTVESDKASFEIESPAAGVLLAIRVPAGVMAVVGAEIATVGTRDEADGAIPASSPTSDAAPPVVATPPPAPVVATADRPRAKASPAARALAVELGVDLDRVTGTGPDGMIGRDDVRAHHAAAPPPVSASEAVPAPSPMRRAVAEATREAWTTVPHVALYGHADVTDIVVPRRFGLTEAIVRAAALALRDHTAFNGWYADGRFTPAGSIDVAVAVSVPGGVMMPVVKGADRLSCAEIGAEIAGMADDARAGRLDGGRTTGASFSVSSLGRFGVDAFAPIIAVPQVAILGVGAVDRRAREAPDGGIVFRSEVTLSVVFDHRANDGAEAAALLAAIVDNLSRPDRLETRP